MRIERQIMGQIALLKGKAGTEYYWVPIFRSSSCRVSAKAVAVQRSSSTQPSVWIPIVPSGALIVRSDPTDSIRGLPEDPPPGRGRDGTAVTAATSADRIRDTSLAWSETRPESCCTIKRMADCCARISLIASSPVVSRDCTSEKLVS